MSAVERFSIDANIFVYAVDRNTPVRQKRAREVVSAAARRECVVTLQTLGEFFRAATRKRMADAAFARRMIEAWRGLFSIASATEVDLLAAIAAQQPHSISFWDAMLLATCRSAGCSTLFSEDQQHGGQILGVTILNPFLEDDPAVRALLS
jgi:predicted nucleic acid-binding protein